MMHVRSNPFSARYIRPGVIPYLFPSVSDLEGAGTKNARAGKQGADTATLKDVEAEQLVDRLEEMGGRAEIVGPHGSGKSTLLASILPILKKRGDSILGIALHDNQKKLPSEFLAEANQLKAECTWIVVDGYEQLGAVARFFLKRRCRRQSLGLLITTHRSQGFPLLFKTETTSGLARRIVNRMLLCNDVSNDVSNGNQVDIEHLLSDEDVLNAFEECNGDMRETLFSLYDRYEQGSVERVEPEEIL